jgi:hypothetical protein
LEEELSPVPVASLEKPRAADDHVPARVLELCTCIAAANLRRRRGVSGEGDGGTEAAGAGGARSGEVGDEAATVISPSCGSARTLRSMPRMARSGTEPYPGGTKCSRSSLLGVGVGRSRYGASTT